MNVKASGNVIGWGQLAVLLFLSRMFSGAVAFPYASISYEMQRFLVVLLGYGLTAVVFLPLFFLQKAHPNENIITLVFRKNKFFGWFLGVLYIAALLFLSVQSTVKLELYVSNTIVPSASNVLLIIALLLVCLYAVFKGLAAIARTSVIIAVVFALFILLVTVALVFGGKIDFVYLYPSFSDGKRNLLSAVLTEFSKNSELVIFALVCRNAGEKARRSLIYLPIGCVLVEWVTVMYMTVLGPYLDRVNFPFYMLSALSDISLFVRLDGIDVAVWTLTVVVKITLFVLAAGVVFRTLVGEKAEKWCSAAMIAVTAALSLYFSADKTFLVFIGRINATGIPLALFGGVIPLIILIIFAGRKKRDKIRTDIVSDTLD